MFHLRFRTAILAMALVALSASSCGKSTQHVVGVDAQSLSVSDTSTASPFGRGAVPNRLAADPRTALVLEGLYAIRVQHDGGFSQTYKGMPTSNYAYLITDLNAYNVVKSWYGGNASLWTGWPSYFSNLDVYARTNLSRSGVALADVLSHGGQCRAFICTLTYRSGTYQSRLPSYEACPWGYRPFSQIRVGDIIETTWANGHTALVVGIVAGVEGQSVTAVRVVDSNFIGDEVIGMHTISVTGTGSVSDLRSYHALNLPLN